MKVVVLPVESISPAEWNPNIMGEAVKARLGRSIERFGVLVPLVVRPIGDGRYETIGGAHRLSVIQERGESTVPCVIVELEDAEARLLSQGLNRIAGGPEGRSHPRPPEGPAAGRHPGHTARFR